MGNGRRGEGRERGWHECSRPSRPIDARYRDSDAMLVSFDTTGTDVVSLPREEDWVRAGGLCGNSHQ